MDLHNYPGCHFTSRRNKYIVENTTSYVSIQEEKGKRHKGNGGKWSSWNKDRAFPHLYLQRDRCADRNDMKRHYLVMDNASIHTPAKVRDLVENRGYMCLYLPPYSPFLNPIEEFWSKVKAGVRRNVLTADDRLSDRICESVQMVTRADCQAWIRHAVSFFPRRNREDINLWEDRTGYSRK